ncbi:alpha-hydroxy acid oxidase [Plantactinospora sp. WMMB334]|uniref:alpha-hydroxy acid oxidase n=1 Tax=Plantactinospora sp. WMMB334 TaxID=3404119 RepID=UPI003B92753A
MACLADLEELARARLPGDVWDFLAGGSGAETTLNGNRAALDRLSVVPRVLAGVAQVSTRAPVLGRPSDLPVAVAPMAYQHLAHPDGEPALARAAARAGVSYAASTLSSRPIEEITATGATVWFQLYWLRDRDLVAGLLDRAEAAGCTAVVLTADVPILGRRLRDLRNSFALPTDVVAANLRAGPTDRAHTVLAGTSAVAAHTRAAFAPGLAWRDVAWLRARTRLPLVVKGILDPRDAVRAVEAGADAVVVSNHGGRQFDAAPPSIVALPPVVDAVAGRCEILLDSGIRSGTDVLRALALGASAVLVGRPLLWALAVGGGPGAAAALSLLGAELRDALTLAGCADPAAARDLRTVTVD